MTIAHTTPATATTPAIRRGWIGTTHMHVRVQAEHPQVGWVPRGTIRPMPSQDWRSTWVLIDNDYAQIGDGPFVGDYLDAEAALLAATSALDEPIPADELDEDLPLGLCENPWSHDGCDHD